MKFGKRLKQQVEETLPEWRDKFLAYKDLKRLVRLTSSLGSETRPREEGFISLLNDEIEKMNSFFMEQEEDFVIRHKELNQRIQKVGESWGRESCEIEYNEQMREIRRDMVNFHGELVLLINYNNINYTRLAKILKKYDKQTGGLLRLPYIQKVLQQPFFTTDLVSKLVRECEVVLEAMFPLATVAIKEERRSLESSEEMVVTGEAIFRNTVAALLTMREIRSGSSTYGHFSLPPLNLPDPEVAQPEQLNPMIPTLLQGV